LTTREKNTTQFHLGVRNTSSNIEIDFIVSAEKYSDWYYSTADKGDTITIFKNDIKKYSCEVERGHDNYWFGVSWYYLNGEQGYFEDMSFTNLNDNDVIYNVEIKSNKEIEISKIG